MSGGGGTGDYPTFQAGEAQADCAQLRFVARVESLQPSEADTVQVGEELTVTIGTTGAIELVRANGRVLGAITERVISLLKCMQEGFEFVAQTRTVDESGVVVDVRASP